MGQTPSGDQVRWASRAADFYRRCGYNPLPSRHDKKAPALATYAECYSEPLDEGRYRAWNSGNVQVVTGVRWDLVVVDCDGKEGVLAWAAMWERAVKDDPRYHDDTDVLYRDVMPWIVRSGGGGLHFWFRCPEGLTRCPSRRLWGVWDYLGGRDMKGGWKPKANVELIGDGKLIVAPPSVHVDTGVRYEWFDIYTPKSTTLPGVIPDWVLEMPACEPPADAVERLPEPPPVERVSSPSTGDEYDREDVLAAIKDKMAVASGWRLRFASFTPNEVGWVACHAVSKASPGSRTDDVHPSARFHVDKGIYMEMYNDGDRPMSLFDLGVVCGAYPDWRSCLNDLGRKFGAVKFSESGR